MGTYSKEFNINWINLNPLSQEIVVEYEEIINLDDSRKVNAEKKQIRLSGIKYDDYFNLKVEYGGQATTLGSLFAELTVNEIKQENPEFTISEARS